MTTWLGERGILKVDPLLSGIFYAQTYFPQLLSVNFICKNVNRLYPNSYIVTISEAPVKETPREKYVREQREDWEAHKANIAKRMSEAKTLKEVAEIKYPFVGPEHGNNHMSIHNYAAELKRDGFVDGANWQSSNPNYINRDKVIEILHYEMTLADKDYLEKLDNLISKIKAL